MQMSTQRSRQATMFGKGNHRRIIVLAEVIMGLWEILITLLPFGRGARQHTSEIV